MQDLSVKFCGIPVVASTLSVQYNRWPAQNPSPTGQAINFKEPYMHFPVRRLLQTFFVVLALATLFTLPGWTQTFRGGISGIVSDSSGAAVSGASVEATNDGTGQVHQTISS